MFISLATKLSCKTTTGLFYNTSICAFFFGQLSLSRAANKPLPSRSLLFAFCLSRRSPVLPSSPRIGQLAESFRRRYPAGGASAGLLACAAASRHPNYGSSPPHLSAPPLLPPPTRRHPRRHLPALAGRARVGRSRPKTYRQTALTLAIAEPLEAPATCFSDGRAPPSDGRRAGSGRQDLCLFVRDQSAFD